MAASATQVIKQIICSRAKHRTHDKRVIGVLSVVPHPRNRSGDPVKSLRTMQLRGTVAKEGYDPVEANSNGVAVDQKPAVARGDGSSFQDDFAQKSKIDPDMLERGQGIVTIAGSLSHSHLNCGMRNIVGGRKGCERPQDRTKCKCASCTFLDDQGNYSITKLESYDEAWAKECHSGLEWELLSWK